MVGRVYPWGSMRCSGERSCDTGGGGAAGGNRGSSSGVEAGVCLSGRFGGCFPLLLRFFGTPRTHPLIPAVHPPTQLGQFLEHFLVDMLHLLIAVRQVTLDVAELAHGPDYAHDSPLLSSPDWRVIPPR